MILVDLSQVMIGSLQIERREHAMATKQAVAEGRAPPPPFQPTIGYFRHLVLNQLRGMRKRFHREYGELVICYDSRTNWRRDVFPHYKASRKTSRDEDEEKNDVDWDGIFNVLSQVRDEIAEFFPYAVIGAEGAEADDVIAAICMAFGEFSTNPRQKILIASSDKDFVQLQKYDNVYQYSPLLKKFLSEPNPERFLREHIMRGDSGDGVPNFLSDGDTFVDPDKRQKSMMKTNVAKWVTMDPSEFCTDERLRINYARNAELIDLARIPKHVVASIEVAYTGATNRAEANGRGKIFDYLRENRLRDLTEHQQDF